MKTILFVSNVSSGLINFRHELIEKLAQDHSVVILAKNAGRVEECEKMGCEFRNIDLELHGTNPLTELRMASLYKKEIKKIDPDIVLTYTIKPNIYAGMACASLGIPYIANITGLGPAVENGGLLAKVTVPLYKYGLRKAKKVFFQNQSNMDFMVKNGIVNCAYDLIPGSGVNLDHFPLLPYPNGDTVDFSFIARIVKEKGINQFLDAAKYFREKRPETRFHVCGGCDKAYEDVLKKLNEDGTIIYHGRISDVVGMHKISSCTVHPSYYPEGMSNVLLESCACGRPIITTDRPGCREIVDDGVNGYMIRQKDSQDLIEKIEKFLSLSWEEKRRMGLAGRAKVEREFDRKIVIQKYMAEISD